MQRFYKFVHPAQLRRFAYSSRKFDGAVRAMIPTFDLETPTFEHPPNPPEISTPNLVNPPPGSTPQWEPSQDPVRLWESFYCTPIQIRGGFSCEWSKWTFNNDFFRVNPSRGFSPAQWILKHLLRVPGDVVPLAYLNASEVVMLFVADRKYYLLDRENDRLLHFGANFASCDDFLGRWTTCPYDMQYLPDLDEQVAELGGKRAVPPRRVMPGGLQ
ncbi:hypothetical protein B0H11DRAFT_2007757 [Mycena galericulata]|nr:hypothetical protein B0H11DRAFT_2007757 [Mycena galericulata]